MRHACGVGIGLGVFLAPALAAATTITIAPGDNYTKIEAAQAGDEVVVAPGTYKFRVFLTKKGTAAQPIVIRAQDPKNPPVWDLSGANVEDQPGSYTAGDRGRGCWQLSGAEYVHISGIVFKNCRGGTFNSAGIRYYAASKAIEVKDCLFQDNDNGITGGTQDSELTVEHCELDHNGNTSAPASAPTHNLYIYGGTFALRYSYVHDPAQAQNMHIRAHDSTIEYNWFARALSYNGDLMTDDDATSGIVQNMTFRGNVVVQGTPANTGQILAVFNDSGVSGMTMKVRVLWNTFVVSAANAHVVHLSNADHTTMSAEISNNVISMALPYLIEDTTKGSVTGTNNWLLTGTNAGSLSASVFGAAAPFKAAASSDFTLAAGSTAIGAASTTVAGVPDREYFQNETVKEMYRPRLTAKDLGAFETTTTGPGYGPYDTPPAGLDGGSSGSSGFPGAGQVPAGGSSSGTSGAHPGDEAGPDAVPSTGDSSGCGCGVAPRSAVAGWLAALGVAALVKRRSRSSSPPRR
jgi:hypothetical protein